MSISEQALWFVCGIGAVVFSAGLPSWRRATAILAGFVLSFSLLRNGAVPDAAPVAGLAALIAGVKLYRPHWTALPAVCGGLLAGALGGLLVSEGISPIAAWPVAAAIPAVTLLLSRDSRFAPDAVIEEGVLLLLLLALGAAAGPAILDGWQSAGSLNAMPEAANLALPAWVLIVVGTSIGIGGMWSAWRHR